MGRDRLEDKKQLLADLGVVAVQLRQGPYQREADGQLGRVDQRRDGRMIAGDVFGCLVYRGDWK